LDVERLLLLISDPPKDGLAVANRSLPRSTWFPLFRVLVAP